MSKIKKSVFGIGFLVLIIVLAMAVQLVAAQSSARVQREEVEWHPQTGSTEVVPGARAKLVRTDGGITGTVSTKELNPGHAYTLWFVIVNNPEECASSPCTAADILQNTEALQADVTYGDGLVAGRSGNGTFSGHIRVGDLANPWFGYGLQSARDAEVHLVINQHGPKIPNMLSEMIHTYRGGCTDESLPPPFPDTAKNDGEPGPNDCLLFQDAIFVP